MTDQETIARFIFMRSQGWSYNKIAVELNVSKPTLIKWGRQHQFDIQNLRAIELEVLQHQLVATSEVRARALAEQLQRVEAELKERDITELSTSRLFSLADTLRQQILRKPARFSSPRRFGKSPMTNITNKSRTGNHELNERNPSPHRMGRRWPKPEEVLSRCSSLTKIRASVLDCAGPPPLLERTDFYPTENSEEPRSLK